jgi:nitroreductase
MNVQEALKNRKSVRAFLSKDVPKDTIVKILEYAKYAPSGVNMQPWQVCVVSGKKKDDIEAKLVEAFENGLEEKMDYHYYPTNWVSPYKDRRKETGLLMYKTLGITREDKAKQKEQWKRNYLAFDAPVVLYFFIDEVLQKGSYLDYGMFLQSIALMATQEGLGSCIMASLAQYPRIVKDELSIDENKILLCAIALGYEDTDDIANSYRTPRLDLEEFVTFY